jgi:hypothetical protein
MRHFLNSPKNQRLLVSALIAMLAVLLWTADRWVLRPTEGSSTTMTDAIFVNAGGSGERLEGALDLVDAGVATNLVLTPAFRNGTSREIVEWSGQSEVIALCENPPPGISVVCLNLDLRSTRGEGRTFGDFATEMGWETITLVSCSHHLNRATLRLSRCFDGEIVPVAVTTPSSYQFYVHEYLGNVEAYLLERAC